MLLMHPSSSSLFRTFNARSISDSFTTNERLASDAADIIMMFMFDVSKEVENIRSVCWAYVAVQGRSPFIFNNMKHSLIWILP